MPQQYTAAQQAYLDLLFKRGDGSVPGSWLIPGSVTPIQLDPTFVAEHDAAYDQRVDTWTAPLSFAGNVVSLNQAGIDHGSIGGLTDDDHTQYHNDARGDLRYQLLSSINNLTVYASGSAYSLTNTPALLDFGTADPSLTIDAAGTYLILCQAQFDYNNASFAAEQTVTMKLRRTNNTPADIANASAQEATRVVATVSFPCCLIALPAIVYTTSNSDDVLELWGDVSVAPSTGSLDAVAASIVAIRIA